MLIEKKKKKWRKEIVLSPAEVEEDSIVFLLERLVEGEVGRKKTQKRKHKP